MKEKQSEFFNELEKLVSKTLTMLPDKPEESAQGTVCALWQLAAGVAMSVETAILTELPELTEAEKEKLKQYIDLRLSGTPLAHITERQQFMGIEFIVGSDALVPRKETELLGNAAINIAKGLGESATRVKVIDVCTGSGNLALAIATQVRNADVFAADLSADAVTLARKNAKNLNLDDRVKFYAGDLLEPFCNEEYFNSVDLLTCNPPYISSGKLETMPGEIIKFEPDMAFDGGPFGIKIVSKLIQEAPKFVREGGWLAFEIGLGQGEPLLKRLKKNKNYSELIAVKNDEGDVRAILSKITHTI